MAGNITTLLFILHYFWQKDATFGEHGQWSLVDKIMEFHEGGKKIERVINVYMNVWVISHPRRSARGNVVLHSWVYPIDSLGYYQKRNRRRGKIEPPTENLDDVMAKSPNRSHGRFGTLTIWVHYQALCYCRQALTSSSDSWLCLIVFFLFFFTVNELVCMEMKHL